MTQEEFKNKLEAFTGPTDAFIDSIFHELVPSKGPAGTVAGEVIRAIGKVGYRYYNDGDVYYQGYGLETVAPSMQYILDFISQYGEKDDQDKIKKLVQDQMIQYDDRGYEEHLDSIFKTVLTVLSYPENAGLFEEKNTQDCLHSDASWFEENQPLFDYEFAVDDRDINKAIEEGYIDTQYLADYMLDIIRDNFGYSNLHNVEVNPYPGFSLDEVILNISNLTKDQYDEVEGWDSSNYFWNDFKEQEKEIFDEVLKESMKEDLDKKSYDVYYDKCKKVKEDYYRFAGKDVSLNEDLDETTLDNNALKECSFKYNIGKKQVIEMIKDAR